MKDIWSKSLSLRDISNQLKAENPRCRYQEILFRLSAVRWELSQNRLEHAKAHLCCVGEALFLLETQTLSFQILHKSIVLEKSLEADRLDPPLIAKNFRALREMLESQAARGFDSLEPRLQKIAKNILKEQFAGCLKNLSFLKHQIYFISHRQSVTKFRRKVQLFLRESEISMESAKSLLTDLERWASEKSKTA